MIVNADDFGYFDEVSRGIVELAEQGIVTATGVMANGPALDRWIDRLGHVPTLSIGVHLNATLGQPLTEAMRRELAWTGGEFPDKGALVVALLRGRITMHCLLEEWRAQIRCCVQAGLQLQFVNSHEHIHMLPQLYRKVRDLANEFGVSHVRAPRPEWGPRATLGGYVHNSVFAAVRVLTGPSPQGEPMLIGVNPSGRLDTEYCRWRFARLRRGATYELMCHPGRDDALARQNPKLGAYHDWEGELHTLEGAEFRQLLRRHQIVLSTYPGSSRAGIAVPADTNAPQVQEERLP
jgi:predicted glycoside hydrolase/deacetylase ChbG (UPF0249 family)